MWCPVEGNDEMIEKADLPEYTSRREAVRKYDGNIVRLRGDRQSNRVQVALRLGSPPDAGKCDLLPGSQQDSQPIGDVGVKNGMIRPAINERLQRRRTPARVREESR